MDVSGGLEMEGDSYTDDDDSYHEDRKRLEGDMVEEWLEEHGQLYPVVSEECLPFQPFRKENVRISCMKCFLNRGS